MSKVACRLVGIAVIAGTLGPWHPADAADPPCSPDLVTEQGACAPRIETEAPTAFQVDQQAAKDADVARIRESLTFTQRQTAGARMSIVNPGGGGTKYELPEVAAMHIYKEGEGNGKKSYTCGPSATRSMVAAMYKRRDGVYKDFGEAQFATWERTTTSGTSRANIAATLNNHFSAFGHWTTTRPSDATEYLSYVISDTQRYGQSVIANIDTEFLGFFNGEALDHFDFVFGYDTTGTPRYLRVAEEWDPIYIYGASSYGNPYGPHWVALSHAFEAIDNTSIHGIVA